MARALWEYQAERFPVFKHGALIVAFGASAVCLSALLRGGAPNPWAIAVAVLVLFGIFFQLRVADEHKDNEDDTKFRPERPVPRGLVTLAELRGVAIGVGVAQVALTAWLDWRLLGLLLLVWGWLAVMTKEFFVPDWLKKRPLIYMISHMAIMPLIDLYATACDWLPAGTGGHEGFRPDAGRVPAAVAGEWLRDRDRAEVLGAGERARRRRDIFQTVGSGAVGRCGDGRGAGGFCAGGLHQCAFGRGRVDARRAGAGDGMGGVERN